MDPRPAPYPADTRAKGWRFELDYERLAQSDTWALAAEKPLGQHVLLMMWLAAWQEVPCGSLPSDEDIIRAKCRVPPEVWAEVRGVAMRGWWLADDGRLYHGTLTQRVAEMLATRAKDRARKSAPPPAPSAPAPPPPGPPSDSAGIPPDAAAKDGTGTGTGTTSPPSGGEGGGARVARLPVPPPAFTGLNADAIHAKAQVPLTSDWSLPEDWGLAAEALGWDARSALKEGEKFRQYWVEGKGKGTRRTVKGWRQSWSNWLGKAERFKG